MRLGRCRNFAVGLLLGLGFAANARGQDVQQLTAQYAALNQAGRYADANRFVLQVLNRPDVRQDVRRVGLWTHRLASTYDNLARYAEAEATFRRAVEIRQQAEGPDSQGVAFSLDGLATACVRLGRYPAAEAAYKRSLAIHQRVSGEASLEAAGVLHNLASLYEDQSRYPEAEASYKRSLAIVEQKYGADHPETVMGLQGLAGLRVKQGRFAEAEALLKRGLPIREKAYGPEHPNVAGLLQNLAVVALEQGHAAEAEALLRRVLPIFEKAYGPDDPRLADVLNVLGNACETLGRDAEAEAILKRALAIQEKALGREHPDVAVTLSNLVGVYKNHGRYAESEPLLKRALAIDEKTRGPEHPDVAVDLNNLSIVIEKLGRYAEAEALLDRALAILEKRLGSDHPALAGTLDNLGGLYFHQGRYAEAEALFRRSLTINEKARGADHPALAIALNNLGTNYSQQKRYTEAEPLLKRSLAIEEKAYGPEHRDVAHALQNLGNLDTHLGRPAEGEAKLQRALAIVEKALGPDHHDAAAILASLAVAYNAEGRIADEESALKRALAIFEKTLGPDHPDTAQALNNLANFYFRHRPEKLDEAETLLDRAIAAYGRAGVNPHGLSQSYDLRAQLSWKAGRRGEAIADLQHALDLAEQQRQRFSGAEWERATSFGGYNRMFERMVAWQAELGDADAAFNAIERAHARSLLDEITSAGVDFQVGRPADELARLHQREGELRSKVAELELRRDTLLKTKSPDSDEVKAAIAALAEAVNALVAHRRDELGSSPVYRRLLSVGTGPPRLSQIGRALPKGAMILVYLFGDVGGYVLTAGPGRPRIVPLTVPKAEAETLGITPGPLTRARLQAALMGEGGKGVVPQLADPKRSGLISAQLAALWRVLIPETDRRTLRDGSVSSLFVVPDGPLALLPFETLVVEDGPEPKYLLLGGPPISCAPSATVLYNLVSRSAAAPGADREPVLTLGDPAYPDGEVPPAPGAVLAARSRFRAVGGRLDRLPYTGWETAWVAKAFTDQAAGVLSLSGPTATEAKVRASVPGRRIVHLACHGLTDQSYGNLFGALALTPGPRGTADRADDGLLTLPEVYSLDLKSCELAILSACETNFGPEQRGEGTWAISRGFIVAGARRVVASNWLVDDEAAANLVSAFCTTLAAKEKARSRNRYAESLQAAKRWIQSQAKWKTPYYWAPLVLVGPA
ncbi:MAG: CHAT domain-containing protein [Isosphaeraceae bacterium]|nr:CHAT domain-containing protein [Isosphaeraceae bacterium]